MYATFAKLFPLEAGGQVLIRKGLNDDNDPCVVQSLCLSGGEFIDMTAGFSNPETQYQDRDHHFDKYDQPAAEAFASYIAKMMAPEGEE